MVEKRTVSGFWKGQTGDVKKDAVRPIRRGMLKGKKGRRTYTSLTESTEPLVEYHPIASPSCTPS